MRMVYIVNIWNIILYVEQKFFFYDVVPYAEIGASL